MIYLKGFDKLGLPDTFKFGIEIEAYNVKTKGKDSLYTGESAKFITQRKWHMAKKSEEELVGKGGAELVSPILTDSEECWKSIYEICEQIKKYPGNKGENVVADNKCGLHIHFDAECLASNPEKMRNFLRLYAESEELLYKMCNDKNNPIRKNAINKNLKGILHIVSSIWRNGMATPTGKKILRQIENGTLRVSYKKFGKLKMYMNKYKLNEKRYNGLNLTNIGNSKKNTIEFRMANGTLNPEIIKQNVFLYSSLINTSIQITENPMQYKENLDKFYMTDVTEEDKVNNFLNLIMESPTNRQIYFERWESVKNADVFKDNEKKGFAQNRFKKDQFSQITQRTSINMVKQTYLYIQQMLSRTNEKGDDLSYGR